MKVVPSRTEPSPDEQIIVFSLLRLDVRSGWFILISIVITGITIRVEDSTLWGKQASLTLIAARPDMC